MKFNNQQEGPVIVGANPSGLLLAAQLLKFGLYPIILDRKSSPAKISPSLSLQPRTMEIFSQLGLIKEVLAGGLECDGLTIQKGKELISSMDYGELEVTTEFPFHLNISQKKIEEILINYIAVKACPICWNSEVLDFQQNSKQIDLKIQRDGEVFNQSFKWLVIAEEAQFNVKKYLSISYNSWNTNRYFFHLVLQTVQSENRNQHLFLTKKDILFSSPINNLGTYDFIGSFPIKNKPSLAFDDIKQILDESLGFPLPVESFELVKFMTLKSELASQYIKQQSLLIGNTAFRQPVLQASEINGSIQDAHNLAWKLANVFNGKQDASILNTYEEERKAIAMRNFKRTYWFSKLLLVYSVLPLRARKYFIKTLVERNTWFRSFSDYRRSELSLHHSLGKKIRAGDRLPFLTVYDEKKQKETDLHQWCKKPGFILLLLGNLSSNSLFIMAQWMKQKYTQHMHLFYLPYSKKNQQVFEAFEVQSERNKMVLIRPDMHIAYIHDVISANLIDTYMTEVMKWRF